MRSSEGKATLRVNTAKANFRSINISCKIRKFDGMDELGGGENLSMSGKVK